MYNLGNCRLTDEIFLAFATLIFMKFTFLGFHVVVLLKTFPLMYQLIMKGWYWRGKGDFSSSAQVKIQFRTLKKIQILGFPCCSTRENLSIDVSNTYVGLILTKPGLKTDRVSESSYGNMSAHKKFKLKAQNSELAVDRNMDTRMHSCRSCTLFISTALYFYENFTLNRVCNLDFKIHYNYLEKLIWKKLSITERIQFIVCFISVSS